MSNWTGRSKGTPLGYRIFIALIRIDIRLAYFLLLPVAFYYFAFSDKKNIAYFYRERLGYKGKKVKASIYNNFVLLGKVLIDKIAILSGNNNYFSFDFEGENHLHEMASNKQGGLLLGAHMGNWEMAGELLERVDAVINIVIVDAENSKLKAVTEATVQKKKVNIIPIKDDMSHLFAVTAAFKRKEFVAMHGDRFVEGAQTITIDFLGTPARFPIGPMLLAGRYEVPISFVFSLKESNRKYHFYATRGKVFPPLRQTTSKQEDIRKMIREYVKELEKIVKKYPLQWFNYHRFWDDEIK